MTRVNPDTQEVLLGDIGNMRITGVCTSRKSMDTVQSGNTHVLITHSMLHLMGYDHMVPEDAALMEAASAGNSEYFTDYKITRKREKNYEKSNCNDFTWGYVTVTADWMRKRRDTGCVRYGTGNIHICTGGSAGK